jgi:hypothetical protein
MRGRHHAESLAAFGGIRTYVLDRRIYPSRSKEASRSGTLIGVTLILASPFVSLVIASCLTAKRYYPGTFSRNSASGFLLMAGIVAIYFVISFILDKAFRTVEIPSDVVTVYGTMAQTALHFAEIGFGLVCIVVSALAF